MSGKLIAAIITITLALVFYTIGVCSYPEPTASDYERYSQKHSPVS